MWVESSVELWVLGFGDDCGLTFAGVGICGVESGHLHPWMVVAPILRARRRPVRVHRLLIKVSQQLNKFPSVFFVQKFVF